LAKNRTDIREASGHPARRWRPIAGRSDNRLRCAAV
jgi:hypothetical protein